MVVTDSSAMALELALENAALNGLDGGQLRTCKLDWYYAGMARVNAPASGCYDLLLASDVLFVGTNVPAVVETIAKLVAIGGCAVVLDPGRPSAEGFEERIGEVPGFDVTVLQAEELRVSESAFLKKAICYLILRHPPTRRTTSLNAAMVAAWGKLLRSRAVKDTESLAELSCQYTEAPPS